MGESMTAFLRLTFNGASRNGCLTASLIALLVTGTPGSAGATEPLTELSLEQLMDVSVVGASKFSQKVSKIASAVTVITRDEIQQYGWRTIAEALRSVPGFYIHNDRSYNYIGARGFARPQDYNSRVLLLIDGYRTNDTIYDMAYVGTEELLDIDLVDRIEVVRGPGSSVYGGNAFFGVINIVTRSAAQIDGVEFAAGLSSYNTREGRATYGGRSADGVEVVASVSGMRSDGPNLYFPEFDSPASNFGRTSGTDYDRNNRRFFGRLSYAGLSLTAAASEREKGAPTGAYGAKFNDPTNFLSDSQAYIDLTYKHALSPESEATGRLYWGDYAYNGPALTGDPAVLNHDRAQANWWGGEFKVVSAWSARNKLIAGIEYQKNYRQKQWNYDTDPYNLYFSDQQRSQRLGIFLQDDFQWTEALNLSLGARFDKITDARGELTPRLGLVYRSSEQAVWKLQYGTAFRAPNAFERFYEFPGSQIANPSGLEPEKLATYEAGVEYYPGKQTRLSATAYHYKMRNLIEQTTNADGLLQFVNTGKITANGLELEAEHQFENTARLRVNLDLPRTKNDEGQRLSNSPSVVAKFLGWLPLPWMGLRLGAEGQWLDKRKTELGNTLPGYGIVNLTLLRPAGKDGWQLSASAYNFFDRKFTDPAAFDVTLPTRDRIEQNGRTFRFKAVYRF